MTDWGFDTEELDRRVARAQAKRPVKTEVKPVDDSSTEAPTPPPSRFNR